MSSRHTESTVPELDNRLEALEKQVKELKADKDEEIKEVFSRRYALIENSTRMANQKLTFC